MSEGTVFPFLNNLNIERNQILSKYSSVYNIPVKPN